MFEVYSRKQTLHLFLLFVEKEDGKKRILKTIEAIERFVLCASIAMGLTQMIALTPDYAETVRKQRYLRTSSKDKVSEATVLDYLRKNIFRLLYLNRHSGIGRLILRLQAPVFGQNANFIPYENFCTYDPSGKHHATGVMWY